MKYLGIDYGRARTGLAVSDPAGRVAVVHSTVTLSPAQLPNRIAQVVEQEGIDGIIVGRPLTLAGNPTQVTAQVEQFVERLQAVINIPVMFLDERMTTRLAGQLLGSTNHPSRDQVAAQILLQNFLDQHLVQ